MASDVKAERPSEPGWYLFRARDDPSICGCGYWSGKYFYVGCDRPIGNASQPVDEMMNFRRLVPALAADERAELVYAHQSLNAAGAPASREIQPKIDWVVKRLSSLIEANRGLAKAKDYVLEQSREQEQICAEVERTFGCSRKSIGRVAKDVMDRANDIERIRVEVEGSHKRLIATIDKPPLCFAKLEQENAMLKQQLAEARKTIKATELVRDMSAHVSAFVEIDVAMKTLDDKLTAALSRIATLEAELEEAKNRKCVHDLAKEFLNSSNQPKAE